MARGAFYLLLLAAAAEGFGAAAGTPHPHKNILILVSDEANLPAISRSLDAMRAQYNQGDPGAVSIFTEYLDLNRFDDPEYRAEILQFEQKKYRAVPLDLIHCVAMPALRLVVEARDRVWPRVPVTFTGVDSNDLAGLTLPSDVTGLVSVFDFEGTVRMALQMFPATAHIAAVAGSAKRDQTIQRQMLAAARRVRGDLDVIDLGGLTLETLRTRLSSLPPNSIVLWTAMTNDPEKRRLVPRDVLASLVPWANAPVFATHGSYLGTGVLGGKVMDFGTVGHDGAVLGQKILYDGGEGSTPPLGTETGQVELDWRELRRWKISDDRIPPGAAILYRPPTAWEEHRTGILVIAGFIGIQSILITLLFGERKKLEVARHSMAELSSNLISAQDEERARIARELHDDLSQRLALFSIEIDQIREQVRDDSAEQSLRNLADKAVAVGADLHSLAHGLHPSKLDHLGLMPAVREFCREVELRSGVGVEVVTDQWPSYLDKNVTLCLYRIVQETLQNVMRHSQCHRAGLRFDGRKREIGLTITDDGCGFDPAAMPRGRGIGLAGMRERLRLVQGRMKVQSKPGAGTKIEIMIPLPQLMNGAMGENGG